MEDSFDKTSNRPKEKKKESIDASEFTPSHINQDSVDRQEIDSPLKTEPSNIAEPVESQQKEHLETASEKMSENVVSPLQ